jgi:P2-related tail formation protein
MDERVRRIGENEALFREVNERVDDINEVFETLTQRMQVVCECGNIDCIQLLTITPDEYRRVRDDSAAFVVARGHIAPDTEHVVETSEDYDVVRKLEGAPAELARELDH